MHDLNELYPELPRATQTKEMDGHQLRPRRSCTSFLIPVLDTSAMIVIPQVQIISSHHHSKADHVHPSRLQKMILQVHHHYIDQYDLTASAMQKCSYHRYHVLLKLKFSLSRRSCTSLKSRLRPQSPIIFQGSSIDSIYI